MPSSAGNVRQSTFVRGDFGFSVAETSSCCRGASILRRMHNDHLVEKRQRKHWFRNFNVNWEMSMRPVVVWIWQFRFSVRGKLYESLFQRVEPKLQVGYALLSFLLKCTEPIFALVVG